MNSRQIGNLVVWFLALIGAFFVTGCSSATTPRDRIGVLPFPGMFTLYSTADPDNLGPHRYSRSPRYFGDDEVERGVIYTTEAGFLDVAHLRMSIDYTRYCVEQIRQATELRKTEWSLAGSNGSVFYLNFNYPRELSRMLPQDREKFADEMSILTGQQLAYLMVTWHEVITWFGHRNVFFVDESRSSFTYDDGMSHLVGVRVAEIALRDKTRPFDEAVTVALAAELRKLGAVPPKQTHFAVKAVEGDWWADGEPLKRNVETGLGTGVIYPWLVPKLPFAPLAVAKPFYLPALDRVVGCDVSKFYKVSIEPRVDAAENARQYLPGHPARFSQNDLPLLLQVVQDQMKERIGTDFARKELSAKNIAKLAKSRQENSPRFLTETPRTR